jgi:hypothetical protein
MKAILNYFDDPKMSKMILVGEGDKVTAGPNNEEFNLTEDKEYEVLEVNSDNLITIVNDAGKTDIYTVECFKEKVNS